MSSRATLEPFPVRGVYGAGPSKSITDAGFNTINVSADKAALDAAKKAGLKAVVWLGEYVRAKCAFGMSDADVRKRVGAIKDHPAIVAYQISDEPNYARVLGCPQVVQQHKLRTTLIHAVDPGSQTYTVISTSDAGKEYFAYQHWVGSVDIIGAVVYPCRRPKNGTTVACDWSMVETAKAELDRDGVARYWAVMQAFDVCWSGVATCYAVPTPALMDEQIKRWKASRMEGYFLYHWSRQASWMLDWLAKHPDVVVVVRNHAAVAGVVRPPVPQIGRLPSPSASPAPRRLPTLRR